ncbi:MAG: hypothetical protein ACTSRS_07095 [Candidatus Helarchaeota archaeon]
MDEEFLKLWNQAKQQEEKGHHFYGKGEYKLSAESHKEAANLFLNALKYLSKSGKEEYIRTMGNYHIEMANYYQSLATELFYRGDKAAALKKFQEAIEEQRSAIEEYEKTGKIEKRLRELKALKATLHFLLAYADLTSAQMAFLNENYQDAIEKFKIAEIHSNLEAEFQSEIGNLAQLKRARARGAYLKGQKLRSEALFAMRKWERRVAKEKYLEASMAFDTAAKLYPSWVEYRELSEKMRKMSNVIRG